MNNKNLNEVKYKTIKLDRKLFVQDMLNINNKINEYIYVINYMKNNKNFNNTKNFNNFVENYNNISTDFKKCVNSNDVKNYIFLKNKFELFDSFYENNIIKNTILNGKSKINDLNEDEYEFFYNLASKKSEIETDNKLEKILNFQKVYKTMQPGIKTFNKNLKKAEKDKKLFIKNTEKIKAIIDKRIKEIHNNKNINRNR